MKFARVVFVVAGIWGIVVLTPFYWLVDITGRRYAPPIEYPHFFYGFFSVAMVWQIAFLIIATDPLRYRMLMLAAMLEKFPFTLAIMVLYARGIVGTTPLVFGLIDGVLGALFLIAYLLTERSAREESEAA